MSLIERLKKNSKLDSTSILSESPLFDRSELFSTKIPMLNVALSGDTTKGMGAGLLMIAGPSKHFKSMFALLCAKAWMDEHPDGILLFYDSEFGSPKEYFDGFGIDTDRVMYSPITDIEKLKFDLVAQLTELQKGDEVMIIIDSIGNAASKKELDDALKESSKADMSRAKAIKGLFRMVTPFLTIKSVPMIAINHTYKETGMFAKTIVSGGTGIYYSSNIIWIIGRRQNKGKVEGEKELLGYDFVIRVEKSRAVKEGATIPITVAFDGGVDRYSGMLDVAEKLGYVKKTKIGKNKAWQGFDPEKVEPIGNVCLDGALDEDFWDPLLEATDLRDAIRAVYKHGEKSKMVQSLTFEDADYEEDPD